MLSFPVWCIVNKSLIKKDRTPSPGEEGFVSYFACRGEQLLQTHFLIGQDIQLSSFCPMKMSNQANNNAWMGGY